MAAVDAARPCIDADAVHESQFFRSGTAATVALLMRIARWLVSKVVAYQ